MPGGIGLGGPLPPGAPEPRAVFYAVAVGRKPGVFHRLELAKESIRGYSGARYKKFYTLKDAEDYLASEAGGDGDGRPPSQPTSAELRRLWEELERMQELVKYVNRKAAEPRVLSFATIRTTTDSSSSMAVHANAPR